MAEVSANLDLFGMKRLEHVTIFVLIVDDVRNPSGATTPAPGQEDGVSIVTVEVHIEPAEHTGSQPPRPLPRVLLRHGSGLPTEGAPDSTPERKEELTVAGAQAQSQESSQEDHQEKRAED